MSRIQVNTHRIRNHLMLHGQKLTCQNDWGADGSQGHETGDHAGIPRHHHQHRNWEQTLIITLTLVTVCKSTTMCQQLYRSTSAPVSRGEALFGARVSTFYPGPTIKNRKASRGHHQEPDLNQHMKTLRTTQAPHNSNSNSDVHPEEVPGQQIKFHAT